MNSPQDPVPHQVIGERVPDFTLPDLNGARTSLTEALDGKVGAVVVFWSGICSHCQRYDAYLNDFGKRYGNLALVVIASRQRESTEDLGQVATRRGLGFRILHDGDRRIAHAWRVEQTPRVFLVDGDGRLLYRGAIDNFRYPRDPEHEPYLEPAITDLLAGRPIGRAETPSFGCPIESVYYGMPGPFTS